MKITKKTLLIAMQIIAIPIAVSISASCASFNKKIEDKKLQLKMQRDKIASTYREGFDEFDNFINNKNSSPFGNLNSFYFKISKQANALTQTYELFKTELKKQKDNQVISTLIKNEFNDFRPIDLNDISTLNIDVWMTKLSVINTDLQAIVESRRRDWENVSNIYRTIYNLELNPSDNTFLSDETQLIKESTQRHIDQAIIRKENKITVNENKPAYLAMWFDKNFVINYNDINVLVNNPDIQNDEKIQNFWHTHSLGNILNEWSNVVIDSGLSTNIKNKNVSINAVEKLTDLIEKIKKEYNDFFDLNSTDLKKSYSNLLLAHKNLINEINKVSSVNGGKFPIQNFLNFFKDSNNNTYNTGPFGKMNKSLEDLYELTKTL